MKKNFTLIFSLLVLFSAKAQNPPSCNAVFTIQYLAGTTEIRFVPAYIGDSTHTTHSWNFGDGSYSQLPSPSHVYQAAGLYTVTHIVSVYSGNTIICSDTFHISVQSQATTACSLIASFNTVTTSSPNSFYFTNTSTPLNTGDSIRWTFGDGSPSVSSLNAVHTYPNYGSYTVCLRVIQRVNGQLTSCIKEYCNNVVVGTVCNLNVTFTVSPGNAINTFNFINNSIPVHTTDSITWYFGDSSTANTYNATHTYANPGTYQVCLAVQQRDSLRNLTGCSRYVCQTITVQSACNMTAAFTFAISPNTNPAVVSFHNTTVNLSATDSITWSFGDSTFSHDINPTHTYATLGTYHVCLIITRANILGASHCVSDICQNISIASPCNIQVTYNYHADSGNAQMIHFANTTNATTAGASVLWSFGDGTTSPDWNPTHTYSTPGNYVVCLRVSISNNCTQYYCDSIIVSSGCYVNSEFTSTHSTSSNMSYVFVPRNNNGTSYHWDFGDGTTSADSIATHNFVQPGTYIVCLTVTASAGCSSRTCSVVIIQAPFICDSVHVSFVYRNDPYIPNKVYFYAIANYPIFDQTWTITRLGGSANPISLSQFNPIYMFQDTGTYSVCLRTVTLGGCVKEICENIVINHLAPIPSTCYLQVYPNPASSNIHFTLFLSQPQMINVYIYNSMNMMLSTSQASGVAGGNTISMYVGNLLPGFYYARVVYGNSVCYARFQKL